MATLLERQWDDRYSAGKALTREAWDESAARWDKKLRAEGIRKTQGEQRVRDAVDYLISRGALTPETVTADVGCGPGRFAAAFAKAGKSALGIDLSPAMVKYGEDYCRELGITNASFAAADFPSADVEALGWAGQFDLAFSSLTPAVRGLKGLENLMALSRAWCFNASFVYDRNDLADTVAREVFSLSRTGVKTCHSYWFRELFDLLWERGYCPESRIYTQYREMPMAADRDTALHVANRIFSGDPASPEQVDAVLRYLEAHADEKGEILEVSECRQGWMLWDKRIQHD